MKNYLNNIKKETMMKNKINFVSGETYSLSELFSGNRKIIIAGEIKKLLLVMT